MYILALLVFSTFFPALADPALSKKMGASRDKSQTLETTQWIFAKVKIQGFLVGKDRFLQYYSLESGNIFDEAKHKHTLAAIEIELHKEGYLDAQVTATKRYDTKNKTVMITLVLNPGVMFKIDSVHILVKGVSLAEQKRLLVKIQSMAENDLVQHNAVQEAINAQAKKIQAYLFDEGYVQSRIELTTRRMGKAALSLAYTVTINQKKRYLFVGNEFYSSQSLMRELFLSETQVSIPADVLGEDIAALYKKKGFYRVKVHMKKERGEVSFIIKEGPRLQVKNVIIQGIPDGMEAPFKKAAAEISALTHYDEDSTKQAIAHLSAELANMGYWSALVTKKESSAKHTVVRAIEGDFVDLIITIKPGERRMITGLAIKGYSELLKQEPFKGIIQSMPLPLSPSIVESQRKWLVNHFRQKGYLYVTVNHELKPVSRKKKTPHDRFYILVWRVDTKGGPVRFGKTLVAGLHRMKPHIVLRELYYKEGDIWDKEKIEQSLKRLRSLGMFESVSVEQASPDQTTPEQTSSEQPLVTAMIEKPIPEDDSPEDSLAQQGLFTSLPKTSEKTSTLAPWDSRPISGKAQQVLAPEQPAYQPLLIKCVEEDPFEIRTRFGLQFVSKSFTHISWSTYKFGGSFVWKNPSGIADQLRLDADFTRFTRNFAASYELPWLGPCPLKTLFSVYSNRFDQPLNTSRQHRLYKEAHDGLSVTFNHLHPWWQSNVMVGFEVNKLYGISTELAKIIQFEPVLVDRNTPYLYIEPSITVERLDNKSDPCRGFLTFISFKAMAPPDIKGGAFVRALFEQSFYHPLFFSVIGALRFRFGHIFNAKFSTILPTERFYLGGATTLRGYETNMVPPLNDLECSHNCLWVPVGGKSMVNVNAEIRFPLYRPVSGVIFTDMGVLAQDKFADIAADKWLGATGFGLRCATPIGPLRFDIGWKWKKRSPKDDSLAWFVTLGHAF